MSITKKTDLILEYQKETGEKLDFSPSKISYRYLSFIDFLVNKINDESKYTIKIPPDRNYYSTNTYEFPLKSDKK